MSGTFEWLRSIAVLITTVGLTATGIYLTAPAADAAPAPIQQPPTGTVTADRLPTVQMDGVAWSQVVVGNTVYVGGQFNNARPAGAAPGTNLTPRANLLAYDITTGNLITSWAPTVNAQVRSITASPDGSRIYAVGDFSTANGQARRRVAAFFPVGHAQAGQLITAFNPSGPNSLARAVIASNSAVYVGGGFLGLQNGTARNNLVAYSTTGAVLPWNPSATGTAGDANAAVWALAKTDDNATIFAGGQFQNVGGQAAYGLAKISAGTGALDTTWRPSVRNAGEDSGIYSLIVQNNHVYGTAWHFGPGGNLEGVFKSPISGSTDPSDVVWVTDCHGDFYSSFLSNGIVYSVGHSHYCGNMGGGHPQYSTWRFQHAQAWNDSTTGDILNDVFNYPNWHGIEPGPAMVNWLPEMAIGSFTGQSQAGWTIHGNSDYVVYGGEFPRVNGVNQQGLVRFARRPISPGTEGPRFATSPWVPTLVPTSTTSLRVSWPTGYDRDDMTLTYDAIRVGVSTPRATINANSQWWNTPRLGFTDTGLTPGQTYSYRVVVRDPGGNTVNGSTASITMPTSFPAASAYAQAVRGRGARIYWPLNETSGLNVTDRAAGTSTGPNIGVNDGRADTGVTWGVSGAIAGNTAASLGSNDLSRIYTHGQETAPNTFTSQVWIRTASTSGGRILGFGDLQTGNSGHRDRQIWMDTSGRINFGVRAVDNTTRVVRSPTTPTYRNNQWHMVTATMGPAGMALYVNGILVGSRSDTTVGEEYIGNWRVGGDRMSVSGQPAWPNVPSSVNFVGSVDEVAIYPTALTASQILAQYQAATGAPPPNSPPAASFTSSTSGLTASVNATASSDPDGEIVSWAWNFGDGDTGSGQTTSHTYDNPGTYTVTLTVTDDDGATDTDIEQVTVTVPTELAADDFSRTVTNGWGSADTGGNWTLTTPSTNFSVGGGVGRMQMATSSGPAAYLNSVSGRDVDLTTSVSYDKPGTGGGIYTSAVVRRIGTSDYRAKVRVTATATTVTLSRTVSGAETALLTQTISGLVYAPGDVLNIRLQAEGDGSTTLRAKVWRSGTAEPGTWTATATDTTSALQAAGGVGLQNYLSGSATNAPVVASTADFRVVPLN